MKRNDRRHGTVNGYSNLKCRCSRCREAWREYVKEKNHRTGRTMPIAIFNALRAARRRHGTLTMAKGHGCLCDKCRAWSAAARWVARNPGRMTIRQRMARRARGLAR